MGLNGRRLGLILLLGLATGVGGCAAYYPDDPYYAGPEYGYAPGPVASSPPGVGYPYPAYGSIDLSFGGGGHGDDRSYRPGYRDRPAYRGNPGWERGRPEHRGGYSHEDRRRRAQDEYDQRYNRQ